MNLNSYALYLGIAAARRNAIPVARRVLCSYIARMTDELSPFSIKNPAKNVPPFAPRFGNAFTRWIGRVILFCMGYKIIGRFPDEPKLVLAGAPHTSNWDLLLAIGTILSTGVRINFMMKAEAFKFPFKKLFIALGGIPIDRSNPKRVVVQTLRAFKNNEKMYLAILPEGTRKSVTSWKSGFIRIADKAGVPIFFLGMDAKNKTLIFDRLFEPTDDYVAQAEEIRLYAKAQFNGMNPENE